MGDSSIEILNLRSSRPRTVLGTWAEESRTRCWLHCTLISHVLKQLGRFPFFIRKLFRLCVLQRPKTYIFACMTPTWAAELEAKRYQVEWWRPNLLAAPPPCGRVERCLQQPRFPTPGSNAWEIGDSLKTSKETTL